jgi:hypothetical protein
MGQYYKVITLNDFKEGEPETVKNYFEPHKYGEGAKLTEFAYFDTGFTKAISKHIFDNPQRLVTAGDYADHEEGYDLEVEDGRNYSVTLYTLCEKAKHVSIKHTKTFRARYILNHDKEVYVDLFSIKEGEDGWTTHPLMLLTAEGNGQGGGDYFGDNEEVVGTWARDLISTSNHLPDGFIEHEVTFSEDT